MPSPIKLTDPLDILVEYGYLDAETPYHKAVSNAVNDFSADQTLGGEHNRDYLSILQNEAKKELKLRRKKISALAFKKGSSVGGAQKVAADTTGASALAIRKPKVSGDITKAEDVTPQDQAQPTESLIGPLKIIDNSVNSIVETLKQSNKADVQVQNDARKAAEKSKRKKAESKLEAITGPIGKAAEKVLAPAKSLFEKIFGFLMTIFAGNIAMRLFDWFGDPKNAEKIKSIFKFLSDWWPVLLAGVMAFMPALLGPGGFILGVVALLAWGIPKILEAINWVKGLFGGGVDKELQNLDKDVKKEGENLGANIDGDLDKDANDILKEAPDVGDDLKQQPDAVKQQPDELQNVPEQKEIKQPPDLNQFNKGGVVPGSGNTDTVPAMLTPGEFVMSKGAVQRYGSGTLAGMNAAAGGTNRPTVGYHGGGTVNNMSSTASAGNMLLNVPSITYPSTLKFSGGGKVPEQVVVNKGDKSKTLSGQIGKTLINFMKVFSPIPFVGGKLASMGEKLVGGVQEVIAEQHKGLHQSSEDSAAVIAKSAPSIKPVKPPSKPTTTVAYDQQMKMPGAQMNNLSPDMELPPFDAGAMISQSKIRTLGLTV